MLRSFSIRTSLEKSSDQDLYVVMKIYSSWHMYPGYSLIGVYKDKDTAIKVAKELAKSDEDGANNLLDNDLVDCDDYEDTTIYFDVTKISEEP